MSKKIAFISTMAGFPWGGSEYLWAAAAAAALKDGHQVFISAYDWSINHPLMTNLSYQGAQFLTRSRFLKPPSIPSRLVRKFLHSFSLQSSFAKSAYQPVLDCNPDIICISQGSSYEAIYIPDFLHLLSTNSIPYIVICQFNSDTVSLDTSTRNTAQQFFNQAACVAFVSHDNLKLAERQLAQSLSNTVIVQNPVNLLDCSLVPFPPQSTVSFASVARLEAACKGQDVLLEALSFPTWKQRDWQCCLYGSGPDQAYLQALAQHYGIGDRIKFMGHINDVRAIWKDNHILVLPSRAEGTPLALVEAMVCGRPAVVTDVGGNTEWIKESQTGFIAEAPTSRSFSAALERAWLVQGHWKQMGVKAHEYATAKFDPSMVQKLLNIILNAAKKE